MPPKKPVKTINARSSANAQSTFLITRAPRDVTTKASHDYRRDTETGVLKSTHLALTLRNGKLGYMGTGELALSKKISGREKLDYLGDYRAADPEGALTITFDMEKCLNIAQSQFNSYVDDIIDLKDRNYFNAEVHNELIARYSRNAEVLMDDKNTVTATIGARIHNTYMLASMWRMIKNGLSNLDIAGLLSDKIRQQLLRNEDMRIDYMMLYDAVNTLVDVAHNKFSSLATSADHFSQYFRRVSDETDEMAFDWSGLKSSYKSYVDSIVIELCLPDSTFPKRVLTALLKEAIDEVPKDAKRFPQALWDALGDLSVAVQLHFIMEAPLTGADGEQWKQVPRDMPDEFKDWLEAQDKSEAVVEALHGNIDFVFPMKATKQQAILDKFWRQVDAICKDKTEASTLLELWELDGELDRTPRWTTKAPDNRALVPVKGANGPAKKSSEKKANERGAIDNDPYHSNESMPSLETVSDSSMESDDEDDVFETSSSEEDDRSNWSGDEDYDTENEEEFTVLQKEIRQYAEEYPHFFDPQKKVDEAELAAERKDNVFWGLLGKLKGRFVRANQTLKTTPGARPAARVPPTARPPSRLARVPVVSTTTGVHKGRTVTVEEVEDEEVTQQAAKKKKKKSKKKKKPAAANGEAQQAQPARSPTSPAPPPAPAPAPVPAAPAAPASPKSPVSLKKKAVTSNPATSQVNGSAPSTAYQPFMSSTSIDLTRQQTAQSAHAYLQNQGSAEQKNKTKSRPNHGNLAPISEKKGFFSRFGKQKDEEPKPAQVQEEKKSMGQWFSNLSRKTNSYMHQLLRTSHDEKKGIASLKWEHFVQMMLDMGFTYDGSTAGSSVRFDPPAGSNVRSISFHKPHPDPTIHPVMLKKFSKKLQDYYGWSEDIFLEYSNSKV